MQKQGQPEAALLFSCAYIVSTNYKPLTFANLLDIIKTTKALRQAVDPLGYGIRKALITVTGQGGGYCFLQQN